MRGIYKKTIPLSGNRNHRKINIQNHTEVGKQATKFAISTFFLNI